MRELIEIQKQLLPDLMQFFTKRYNILYAVMQTPGIGRRPLASTLLMSERTLRTEVDFLKSQGLIEIDNSGMRLSLRGRELMNQLTVIAKELFELTILEERLATKFQLKQCIIVPGDSETSVHTKREMGRVSGQVLLEYLEPCDIVAVTGGSTMAELAQHFTSSTSLENNWFVPARGGLGESLEHQANTIASSMAASVGAHYRLFHVPESLSEETYTSLLQEPSIQEPLSFIQQASIVVHGIGQSDVMAQRRGLPKEIRQKLMEQKAVAEAFGYYFDAQGHVVHQMLTLGIHVKDLSTLKCVIAIAGGTEKVEAIAAVLQAGHENVLVTDEAAAKKLWLLS